MKLKLSCVLVETNDYGKVKREVQDVDIADIVNGIEIQGKKFIASKNNLDIIMEGDFLSEGIRPNYKGRMGESVMQIGFKKDAGRATANILNKFLRRINKELSEIGKGNALLIREVALEN